MKDDMKSKRYEKGVRRLEEMGHNSSICSDLDRISPDLKNYIYEFAFGDVHSRTTLSKKEREIAIIASLVTLGHADVELESHINMALSIGCSCDEIKEVIMQMAVYAGFPAAVNGMYIADKVFVDRGDS